MIQKYFFFGRKFYLFLNFFQTLKQLEGAFIISKLKGEGL